MWLLCVGARCWMTMKAMPGSPGRAPNSSCSAVSPPADAPMPTTWNCGPSTAGAPAAPSAPSPGSVPEASASGAGCGDFSSPASSWTILPPGNEPLTIPSIAVYASPPFVKHAGGP